MCRWVGYSGAPIFLEELILKPTNSLIDQSLSSKEGVETTNGDGFGLGWYGEPAEPGVYKGVEPAWNDSNLKELSRHIKSPLFLAHVRATTGTPVQRTNCHPFRHGKWLFVHNGVIHGFHHVRRELAFNVDASLFANIEGTTDSEIMFNLALTFGLEDDPFGALERMAGLVETTGAAHGIDHPLQMTLGLGDGERLYAVRYSSERASRSLYHSKSMDALRRINPAYDHFSSDARAVVSEPLSDMADHWTEVPESSGLVVEGGEVEIRPFTPRP